MDNSPGDSAEQRDAETTLLNLFSNKHNLTLHKKRISLDEGNRIELDGFSESPPLICEAWAHIGSPKAAQRSKVMKDALKLIFAKSLMNINTKCYLIFADNEAARPFLQNSWMAQCLKQYDINIEVLELPQILKDKVLKAQARQYR